MTNCGCGKDRCLICLCDSVIAEGIRPLSLFTKLRRKRSKRWRDMPPTMRWRDGEIVPSMRGGHPIPDPPMPKFSTDSGPGSPEKIEVLRERVARGESLFHPKDCCEYGKGTFSVPVFSELLQGAGEMNDRGSTEED